MPLNAYDVCLSGKTGSERHRVEVERMTLSVQSPCLSCCCIGEAADTMPPDLEDVDATTQIYYLDR
jgi:hypothetical protein